MTYEWLKRLKVEDLRRISTAVIQEANGWYGQPPEGAREAKKFWQEHDGDDPESTLALLNLKTPYAERLRSRVFVHVLQHGRVNLGAWIVE